MTHTRNIPARKLTAALPVVRTWEERQARRRKLVAQMLAALVAGGRRSKPEVLAAEAGRCGDERGRVKRILWQRLRQRASRRH